MNLLEGFLGRFKKELKRGLPNEVKTRVLAPAKRDIMYFLYDCEGGSSLQICFALWNFFFMFYVKGSISYARITL
jgi:hypothetical protein